MLVKFLGDSKRKKEPDPKSESLVRLTLTSSGFRTGSRKMNQGSTNLNRACSASQQHSSLKVIHADT